MSAVEINGKQKWAVGIVGTVGVSLLAWNFSAVYGLQLSASLRDEKLLELRTEFDSQRASELAFRAQIVTQVDNAQTEMRRVIASGHDETRSAIGRVTDILTEVRIKLGAIPTLRNGPK